MDLTLINGLRKQARVTVAEQAYTEIRQLLMTGSISPGEKVTLRGLASALNISPMPVRDAVSKLVAEGALQMLPNRTLQVPKPTLQAFREIVKIRCCLEGFAALEAAQHISEAELNKVRSIAEEYESLAKRAPFDAFLTIETNRRLHFSVYQAAGMPQLVGMIENIWLQISPLFSLSMNNQKRTVENWESFRHHRDLVAALTAGNGEGAREAIVSDITDAARFIEKTGQLEN
ncbi:GntR family transcriptional regulator [Pollutimonas bauzanensis]|uniref:DNA-binding transcriptional regulator, GntR family n=1 Tax=Pollutimonas bauzanensis TaxID=658167 RepID=A0A1M5ZXR7_9BURK|nr:GntR family transcriptional regulator [Pollutimonas bauzanensis]SHI28819.1 DNA-binding transcriptional regulator, GntR family [Pollutimonas bauzanensis]